MTQYQPGQPPQDQQPPQQFPQQFQQQGPPQQPPYPPQQGYPGQPYQPMQPPKKKHTVRNVFIVLAVLAVVGIGGCVAIVGSVGNQIDKKSNEAHAVVYKVGGTSKAASLTYTTDGSTTTEQIASAKLPWTKSLSIKGLIPVYQVMAQNAIGQSGTVTCSIEVDGKVAKTATASGEGAIASCDYTP
jgi:hypothetical protein